MKKYLNLNNLEIKIEDKTILSNFSITAKENTCILGESGSGKTLLVQHIKKMITTSNIDMNIDFFLNKPLQVTNWKKEINYENKTKTEKQFFSNFLKSNNTKEKMNLAFKIANKPDILICDELPISKEEFMLLQEYTKKENIILLYVTNDIEKVLYSDYLIVLKNNQIAIEGKTQEVLKEEKIMKTLGFSLPFYINMSIQLGYYGLLNDIYLNKEQLEGALWQSK